MTVGYYNIYQQLTSVRVVATTNLAGVYDNGPLGKGIGASITFSSLSNLVIDGVTLNTDDRILLISQTNQYENGIYTVTRKGAYNQFPKITRAEDFQSVEQINSGQYITIGAGTSFKGSAFVVTEPIPSAIGVSEITFTSVADSGSITGPYLLKSANLSDVANTETAFANLGFGSGQSLTLTDSDFSGGIYTLSNPCPNYINVNATTPGLILRLPLAQGLESFSLSEGPYVQILQSGQILIVEDNSGSNVVSTLEPSNMTNFSLSDKSTSDGVWLPIGRVSGIGIPSTVLSGLVNFESSDNSITIAPLDGKVDLTVAGGGNVTLQEVYDNGTSPDKGQITLTSGNPIRTVSTVGGLGLQRHSEYFNNTNTKQDWGNEYYALNSSSSKILYSQSFASIKDDTAGSESASYTISAKSFGAINDALVVDGLNQNITSSWPMHIANGAQVYTTTFLLTGDVTYSGQLLGYNVLSDDLLVHDISLPAVYFSTNADDTFIIQTQSNNAVTITPSGGTTINGSTSVVTIPPLSLARINLVNPSAHGWLLNIQAAPQSAIAFSSYSTPSQSNVTGDGTLYTVIFDTAVGTSSPNFNYSTGEFTAPINGFYQLSSALLLSGITGSNILCQMLFSTSSQSLIVATLNPSVADTASGTLTINGSATLFLNAGDVVSVQLGVSGSGTPNISLSNSVLPLITTFFTGSYAQQGVGTGSSGNIDVTDDNSTNATMYPVWVAGNSGSQNAFVSSTEFYFNPSNSNLTIGSATSPPTLETNLNLFSNSQYQARIILSGQDYLGSFNQSDGIAFLLGVNNTNSRQLLIADSANASPGPSTPALRIAPTTTNVIIDCVATDLSGELPLQVGNTGGSLLLPGTVNFPNLTNDTLLGLDSSKNVVSVTNTFGQVNVTDDNSTNSTMYPLWVSGTSGDQSTFVSSTELSWNPSSGSLTMSNAGPFGPTFHINSTSGSDASSWVYHESSGVLKAAFGYRDSISSAVIYLGSDRLLVNNSGVVQIPQLTANMLVATDSSSNLISVPNTVSSSYAILGYSLNTNGTTITSTNTYYAITLNTPTTTANTTDFAINGATGEITYNGAVPTVLRISCMTTGLTPFAAQACNVAPATDVGSGYVVYDYLAASQVFDSSDPISVTTTALVPVVVSGAKFQMFVENNTATNYFLGQTMYFSVEVL